MTINNVLHTINILTVDTTIEILFMFVLSYYKIILIQINKIKTK